MLTSTVRSSGARATAHRSASVWPLCGRDGPQAHVPTLKQPALRVGSSSKRRCIFDTAPTGAVAPCRETRERPATAARPQRRALYRYTYTRLGAPTALAAKPRTPACGSHRTRGAAQGVNGVAQCSRRGRSLGFDDGDSRRRRGGDRGEPLAVQPPVGHPPGRPGRDTRNWAAGSPLVAVGQSRGSRAALHADALDPLPSRACHVEDDLLAPSGPGL